LLPTARNWLGTVTGIRRGLAPGARIVDGSLPRQQTTCWHGLGAVNADQSESGASHRPAGRLRPPLTVHNTSRLRRVYLRANVNHDLAANVAFWRDGDAEPVQLGQRGLWPTSKDRLVRDGNLHWCPGVGCGGGWRDVVSYSDAVLPLPADLRRHRGGVGPAAAALQPVPRKSTTRRAGSRPGRPYCDIAGAGSRGTLAGAEIVKVKLLPIMIAWRRMFCRVRDALR